MGGNFLIMILEKDKPRGYLQSLSVASNTFSWTDSSMNAKCYTTRTAANKDLERLQAITKGRDFICKVI